MIITIGTATNRKYLKYSYAMISSVYENTMCKDKIFFKVFSRKSEKITSQDYEKIIEKYSKINLEFFQVDDEILSKYPTKRHITSDAYLRLLMPILLKKTNKLLYLDSDLIVVSPIEKLYRKSLSGHIVGAIRDKGFEIIANSKPLFNSGVLLIDCKRYREGNYLRKLLSAAEKEYIYGYSFADQDTLNYVFSHRWKKIDYSWNYTTHDVYDRSKPDIREINVIHYTGGSYCKPDHILCDNPYKNRYYAYKVHNRAIYVPAYISRKLKSLLSIFGLL